jgi:inhibitor of cysteine peptidase
MLVVLIQGCSTASQLNLTAQDNGKSVSVSNGGQIVVTLDGNPSTGYTWTAQGLNNDLLKQVGDARFISSNPGAIGSGGTLTLTFTAEATGTTPLTLIYHRPWDKGIAPLQTFTVTVTVK